MAPSLLLRSDQMGLELTPTQRRYLPRLLLGGAGLLLIKVTLTGAARVSAGEALTAEDYGAACVTLALIYMGVRLARQNKS